MSGTAEADITINGRRLSAGQSMTVRCAIEAFAESLRDGLGNDEHGRRMTAGYLAGIAEIMEMIHG